MPDSPIAGSVRIPAAFCGNFGLKPSFGRVPAYPLSPMGTVAHLGPHTMDVRDATLAMNVGQLQVRRGALGSHMRQFMQHYDLLVTPSVAVPAFEIRPPGTVPMSPESMLSWTPFSYPFNLTQQPACTVPCGLTADGLPIGIQFVGPMFRDDVVCL